MSTAAAIADTPPTTAPAESPSQGVPAPAGGAPGSGGGSSAQPATGAPARGSEAPAATPGGSTQAPAADGGKAPEEPHVPWRKFREVQTDATRARQGHQAEMQRVQNQIAQYQQQVTELSRVRDDFSTLEQLLEDNPDLAEQLFQRAGQAKRGGAQPASARPDDAATREIRELRSMIQQDREQQQRQMAAAREQAETSRTDQELVGQLKGLLVQHELDEGWLPHVRAYVLDVARRIPNLDMTEVPYVFAEWARPMHSLLVKQLDQWRAGKLADQRTMPAATNGNGAVIATPGTGFGPNDRRTAQYLEEQLKARLGWRNE